MILPITVNVSQASTRPPLWMQREDREVFGYVRSCASCPAVFVLKEESHTFLDEQWQYFLRAINYNMELENVYLLLDYQLAFANGTGFRKPGSPKADYFHLRDLSAKPPSLDKVRTCSRNVMTGSFQGNFLKVTTFDSRTPPPLKSGRSYPNRVEDARVDDYLFVPQTHPWLFLVANIVNRSGEVGQFPRGAVYSWTGDLAPRSFLPLISNHAYGDVLYDLAKLRPVGPNEPIPSPYRFS